MTYNTMTLEQKILNRIKEHGVKPKGRGYFALRNTTIWISSAISVVILGLAFGMIMFFTRSTDSSVIEKLELSATERIFSSLPILWIIVAIIIAGIGYISIRSTRRGYRISIKNIVLVAAVIAALLGGAMYSSNLSEYVDEVASKNVPLYNNVAPINTESWFDPVHGLLSGTVKERDSNSSFTLRDKDAELWDIVGKDGKDGDDNAVKMPEGYQFHVGDRIKMIGKQTGPFTFEVREIYPWVD